MSEFTIDPDLEIGTVFEVAGSAIKVALSRKIRELTRSHGGRVYDVGQIGSLIKIHLGRRILFATVSLLRLQSDEEVAAIATSSGQKTSDFDRRVIEADLLGEAWFHPADNKLNFRRGVSTYPLPLQAVHLVTKEETEKVFRSVEKSRADGITSKVVIGTYVGATKVDCHADMDKLFSQHCAVLGSTGSGKSSAVSAIIHAVLESRCHPNAPTRPTIVLIDPHGEYAKAFGDKAKVFRAYDAIGQGGDAANLILPYWLMSSDEFRSLIIGKTEFEATSQANVIYKALAHARMFEASMVESSIGPVPSSLSADQSADEPVKRGSTTDDQIAGFDRDKPRPFKIEEFRSHITQRQAKRRVKDKWEDITPSDFEKNFASILNKLRVLTSDPRIRFLMREHGSASPTLDSVLKQFLNVDDTSSACLKIIDISGLPNEVAGPLTGSIARLLFQYKLHQSRAQRERDPVLLVCEEAHRYVPDKGDAQYQVAQDAIRRIAREGRKYGLGLMLVSQRPADIEGTVIAQCNTWIVLRLSNAADQQHVARFLPDGVAGMTKLLSSLPRQEALFVGEAAAIPARIRLRLLAKDQLPDSDDLSFAGGWSSSGTTQADFDEVLQRMGG